MHRAIPRLPRRPLAQCLLRRHHPLPTRFLSTASDNTTSESSGIATYFRRKLWGADPPPSTPSPTPQSPSLAELPTAAPAIDPNGYTEETDARSLPVVGLAPGLARYDVRTFASPITTDVDVPDVRDVHVAVHRAVVEVFTRVVNGIEPEVTGGGGAAGMGIGMERDGWTGKVGISVREDGGVEFLYGSEEVEKRVLGEWGVEEGVEERIEEVVEEGVKEGVEAKEWIEVDGKEAETEAEAKAWAQAHAELDAKYEAQSEIGAQEEVEVGAGEEAQREAQPETEAAEAGLEATEPLPSSSEEPTPPWLEEGLQGRGWVHLPLRTNDIKFAVFKRVYQLTSLRPRDADIPRITTASKLIDAITAKPRPKKLFETLKETEAAALPNVRLLAAKVRPWDKARVIGMERPIEKVVGYKYAFEK